MAKRRRFMESDTKSEDKLVKLNDAISSIELFSKEVLSALIADSIPPTPNNYALYFDRELDDKDEEFKKQIQSILELEESDDSEKALTLERTLKDGFNSVKNILNVTANLYKNINLMIKILEKRKEDIKKDKSIKNATSIIESLDKDINKLNTILEKQTKSIKTVYNETANIIKKVEGETIFDNKYGIYNKRYLIAKISKEIDLIKQYKHKSSLLMLELSKDLKKSIQNEKIITLMTRTIARLLLKTSRRSDTIAHYGNGIFALLLKHTDIEDAKRAAKRLLDLVSNSNFFIADKEIQLKISIGITDINTNSSAEEIIVYAVNALEEAYKSSEDYFVRTAGE